MKTLTSILTALALALVLAIPALAGGDERGDTVTKTFRLTIDGEVDAPDRVFAVTYWYSDDLSPAEMAEAFNSNSGQPPANIEQRIALFCGPDAAEEAIEEGTGVEVVRKHSLERCEGDGAKYSFNLEFPKGTTLGYSYDTAPLSAPQNVESFAGSFESGPGEPATEGDFEALDSDRSNSATYDFGDVPGIPSTGAGGMAGGGLPIGGIAAILSLLTAAGYALRRRI